MSLKSSCSSVFCFLSACKSCKALDNLSAVFGSAVFVCVFIMGSAVNNNMTSQVARKNINIRFHPRAPICFRITLIFKKNFNLNLGYVTLISAVSFSLCDFNQIINRTAQFLRFVKHNFIETPCSRQGYMSHLLFDVFERFDSLQMQCWQ